LKTFSKATATSNPGKLAPQVYNDQDIVLTDTSKQTQQYSSSAASAMSNTFTISEVISLEGHEADVFACCWNPRNSFLASGYDNNSDLDSSFGTPTNLHSRRSGDGTARIWKLSPDFTETGQGSITLSHAVEGAETKAITSLDWNVGVRQLGDLCSFSLTSFFFLEQPSGTQLATACYDGTAKIWSKTGKFLK
jgi:transducin (beta)-like 1